MLKWHLQCFRMVTIGLLYHQVVILRTLIYNVKSFEVAHDYRWASHLGSIQAIQALYKQVRWTVGGLIRNAYNACRSELLPT